MVTKMKTKKLVMGTYETELIKAHMDNFLRDLEAMSHYEVVKSEQCLCIPLDAIDAIRRDYGLKPWR